MNNVEINKNKKLSQHFTLGELTKTSYHTLGGNIPSHVAIENLTRLCLWLELLRERYNRRYGDGVVEIPVVITSGYRSEEVNRLCGGAKGTLAKGTDDRLAVEVQHVATLEVILVRR